MICFLNTLGEVVYTVTRAEQLLPQLGALLCCRTPSFLLLQASVTENTWRFCQENSNWQETTWNLENLSLSLSLSLSFSHTHTLLKRYSKSQRKVWDVSQYPDLSKKGQIHYPSPVMALALEEGTSASLCGAFPRGFVIFLSLFDFGSVRLVPRRSCLATWGETSLMGFLQAWLMESRRILCFPNEPEKS